MGTTEHVRNCSACGQDHPITFYLMREPDNVYTHEGLCESTQRIVYMRYETP